MERMGECHCGALKAIATGEPERVYICHCIACQRRTGTAFHYGATFRKERVRLDGVRKVYERGSDSGYPIRWHFCPDCGTTLYWEGDRNPAVCGVAVGAFPVDAFPRRAIRFSRSRCTPGSACRRKCCITRKAARPHEVD